MVELGTRVATERAAMDTLYLTVRAPRFYPTICVVVEADAVRRAEGSIWMTVTQGHQEPPESLAEVYKLSIDKPIKQRSTAVS